MQKTTGKFIIIDTETTGLHPARHGLVQVAAASLDSQLNILNTFCVDVCPPDGYEIDPEAMRITGFTEERINGGMSYAKLCETFLEFIRSNFKGQQPIAVGQFYPFDYAFLDYVFTISGYGDVMNKAVLNNQFIDTKALTLSLNLKASLANKPLPFPITSLSKPGGLKDKLHISQDFTAHDALGDVLATREVLIKLVELLPDLELV